MDLGRRSAWGRGPGSAVLVALLLVGSMVVAWGWGGSAGAPPAFKGGLSLAAGEARSAQTGRPVLVLATADWCGPCRAFKRGALRDEDLNRLIAERTVPVYLDVDKDRAGAGRLGVFSIPALVMVRGGRVVSRLEGVRESAEVEAWLISTAGDHR